jgi:hypothetical protein
MTKRKAFAIGDYVKEKSGSKPGVIVHIMRRADPPLYVVRFPPATDGIAYHEGDLEHA